MGTSRFCIQVQLDFANRPQARRPYLAESCSLYYGLHDLLNCSPPRLTATQLFRILVVNGFNYTGYFTRRARAARERTNAERRLGTVCMMSSCITSSALRCLER